MAQGFRGKTLLLQKEDCWCRGDQAGQSSQAWNVKNSQLLEAAFNGTLSLPVRRRKEELFQTSDEDPESDGLEAWLKKEFKSKSGEEIRDLLSFLHAMNITFLHELETLNVDQITHYTLKEALSAQKQRAANVENKDIPDKAVKKKMQKYEDGHCKWLTDLAEDQERKQSLQEFRYELKKKLDLEQVLDLLMDQNADPNVFDRTGISPLHYAAKEGRTDDIKLLIHYKADIKIADINGNTPLHYAAMYAASWTSMEDTHDGKQGAKCDLCGRKKHVASTGEGEEADECKLGQAIKLLKGKHVCQNSMGKTPAEKLTASAEEFLQKAKQQEKDNKDGAGWLFGGISAAEEAALQAGKAHSDRMLRIAKDYFSKGKH
eukprot:CAMPEP_0181306360 /NCGR_PEP_ID=MMETSP1101-20121128/10255_1 /TAXON_ID=46948 /ORGANISM="Rhodomonas abbreviata, Strain Caron Lab Isolate" /LENGTH=374 /DNA_ID=CAMNT_0023412405 /DNA_START=306 /DNA_END=1431 /DNA_ORIENTATION=+